MEYGASIFTFLRKSGRLRISDSFRGGLSIIGFRGFIVVIVRIMVLVVGHLVLVMLMVLFQPMLVFAVVCLSCKSFFSF